MDHSPDAQHGEGSVLHAQSQLRAVVVEGDAADRLLHVAASQQGVVEEAPEPAAHQGVGGGGGCSVVVVVVVLLTVCCCVVDSVLL